MLIGNIFWISQTFYLYLDYKISLMRKGKKMLFNEIKSLCVDNDLIIEKFGDEFVGEHFILCKHKDKGMCLSFYLDSVNKKTGNIYECIYTDFVYLK
jgi:hypothetical protein